MKLQKKRQKIIAKRQQESRRRKIVFVGCCLGIWVITLVLWELSNQQLDASSTAILEDMKKVDTGATSTTTTTEASVTETTTTKTKTSASVISGVLRGKVNRAEVVWEALLQEAKNTMPYKNPGIVMEIGMHSPFQCRQAAEAGLEAHCVEASAANMARIQTRVSNWPQDVTQHIHLYHNAAGSVTGRILEFYSGGGTGDRVGHVDVWAMEKKEETNLPAEEKAKMTQVEELRMDDIVLKRATKPDDGAFLMKIDTQGFEPHVFSGMDQTLAQHKAKFILFEYWPKGMDLMTSDNLGDCSSVKVLQKLLDHGYQLYQLEVVAHPQAPGAFREYHGVFDDQPLDDLQANCRWYYDLEQRFPNAEYKMGYWSDILAVAPNYQLKNPITPLGTLLFSSS